MKEEFKACNFNYLPLIFPIFTLNLKDEALFLKVFVKISKNYLMHKIFHKNFKNLLIEPIRTSHLRFVKAILFKSEPRTAWFQKGRCGRDQSKPECQGGPVMLATVAR